jgi:hypothetical protein
MLCHRLLCFSNDILALLGTIPSSQKKKDALQGKLLGRYCVIVPLQGSTPGPVYAYALR